MTITMANQNIHLGKVFCFMTLFLFAKIEAGTDINNDTINSDVAKAQNQLRATAAASTTTTTTTTTKTTKRNLQIDTSLESWHIRTTSAYSRGGVTIENPLTGGMGDDFTEDIVLMLFLSASSGPLPLSLADDDEGWYRVAECVKSTNRQAACYTAEDCTDRSTMDNDFCSSTGFPSGSGHDLGTVVYYKIINPTDPKPPTYAFNMLQNNPTWAIMTAMHNVDTSTSFVRNVALTSNDGSFTSVFPRVEGETGDILLLSMAFDDPVSEELFLAPRGTQTIGYVGGRDETGFLYGRRLHNKRTLLYETQGPGNSKSKDALISMTIRTRADS